MRMLEKYDSSVDLKMEVPMEQQIIDLEQRVLSLEHALSDLLVACDNGTYKQGQCLGFPNESAMKRLLGRHYNLLVSHLDPRWKRESFQFPR